MWQKWHAYLHAAVSKSPLGTKLHAVLGPVEYGTLNAPLLEPPMEAFSQVKEDTYLISEDAWYVDDSNRGNRGDPNHWTVLAIQPQTDTICFETRPNKSS